jgi:hypothetical protein
LGESAIIDKMLLSKQNRSRIKNVLYVKDITKPCPRKAYLDITDYKPFSLETMRVLETGNILEKYWIKLLKQDPEIALLGTQIPAQYQFADFRIHGRADAIAQHKKGELRLHEVKSIKSFNYLSTPQKEHVEQLQFYLNILGVEVGQIDYIDKAALFGGGDSVFSVDASFRIYRDKDFFTDLILRANDLYRAIRERKIPEIRRGWICDYCLHKQECLQTVSGDPQ